MSAIVDQIVESNAQVKETLQLLQKQVKFLFGIQILPRKNDKYFD